MGVVFTRSVDVNRVGPPEGETVHVVSAGHPDTLRETGPDVSPKIRTVAEEKLLRGAFPDEYDEYAAKVPAFIPFVKI